MRTLSELIVPGSTTDLTVIFEICTVFLALILSLFCPWLGHGPAERVEKFFRSIARRRTLTILLPGMLALGLRFSLLPLYPIPQPIVHDEFSYLLAGETFSEARLSNPPHPMRAYFESMHVNMYPRMMSKYPPLQGLILAAGRLIFGHPWFGVWLSMGILCSMVTWMLAGWFSGGWALLGGLLAAVRYGVAGYWINSYWGGGGAAIGGALLLGALPRLKDGWRTRDALWMSLGIVMLLNSRPYEGLLFSVPLTLLLAAWMLGKNGPSMRIALKRVVLPSVGILALAAVLMGYYNYRNTGNALLMPHQLYRSTYAVAPMFLWESPRPIPSYNHPIADNYFVKREMEPYWMARTLEGDLKLLLAKLRQLRMFYLSPVFMLAIVPVFWRLKDPRLRVFLLGGIGIAAATFTTYLFGFPHYAAPFFGADVGIVIMGLIFLRDWHPFQRPAGLWLSRAVPLICVTSLAACLAVEKLHLTPFEGSPPMWCCSSPGNVDRTRFIHKLRKSGGKHLIIVRFDDPEAYSDPWVYNEPDIDKAPVVWARETRGCDIRELLEYFKDRKVWLLRADREPRQLQHYDIASPR